MGLLLTSALSDHVHISLCNPVNTALVCNPLNIDPRNATFLTTLIANPNYNNLRWWGIAKKKSHIYSKLRQNNEVLFSQEKTGLINHYGRIINFVPNPDIKLARAIWGANSDHEYIFIMDSYRPIIGVDRLDFLTALGFNTRYDPARNNDYRISGPNIIESSNSKYATFQRIRAGYGI